MSSVLLERRVGRSLRISPPPLIVACDFHRTTLTQFPHGGSLETRFGLPVADISRSVG